MTLVRRAAISLRRCLQTSARLGIEQAKTLQEVEHHEENVSKRLFETFLKLEEIDPNIYRQEELVQLLKQLSERITSFEGDDLFLQFMVIGQALSAASNTVDSSYIPHSLHSYFLKTGSVTKPILYSIDRTRDGRSFCTRNVKAIQDGETIFTAQISYQKQEKDSIKHTLDPPKHLAAGPNGLLNIRELIDAELAADDSKPEDEQMNAFHRTVLQYKIAETPPTFHKIFESRPVDQNIFKFRAGAKPNSSMWIRALEPVGNDWNLQRALAAYISDAHLLESAILPHVGRGVVPSMIFSLDHAIWFHRPTFHVDDWMLYESFSTWAGQCRLCCGGRAFTHGHLWSRNSDLVLSCTQEGLVRTF